MATDKLNEALSLRPWPPGDPWVLVEAILNEVEQPQQKQQVMGLALEAAAAHLQANVNLINGLRQVVAGSSTTAR